MSNQSIDTGNNVDPKDLEAFRDQAEAWFAENTPRDVDVLLPLTFMEVGTDAQFHFLREWQNKVYQGLPLQQSPLR